MREIRNLVEANAALADFIPESKKTGSYSLERMYALMDFLGNPQNKLRVIHVAGTSGKTSTCYYVASLLKEAGHKVGLSVSPHVVDVNERVQINLDALGEADFCRALGEFLDLTEQSKIDPTYFELLVAMAYWEFDRRQVDYAVMEVGLGGSLDGTNIVNRDDKVCVITDIGLDHINVLGETLPEIAVQKAGIIQPKNEVFTHRQAPEILDVFKKRCNEQQANLQVIKPLSLSSDFDFLPLFQHRNFSLAMAAADFVLNRDEHSKLSSEQQLTAAHVKIPARMETFQCGNKTIILDGAHNYQKLHALSESIKAKYPGRKVAALVSFVDGRGYRLKSSLEELHKLTDMLIITSFLRAKQDLPYGPVEPAHLAELAHEHNFAEIKVADDPQEAYKELLARPEPILLITGSFYLMDDLRDEVLKK